MQEKKKERKKERILGQVQVLMPVIPALWEAEVGSNEVKQSRPFLANMAKLHFY